MKIIVGLGNPGEEYEKTRHNVGFQIIDLIKDSLNFDDFKLKKKFDAFVTEGTFREEKIVLVKPNTFMNLSGKSIQALVNFYKVNFHDLWIIHDDLDFETGAFKLREKGGPGSHNGMISVIKTLGTEDFPRFRIGIENRDAKQKKSFEGKDYVLGRFTAKEEKIMKNVRTHAAETVIFALGNGINEAMNKYN